MDQADQETLEVYAHRASDYLKKFQDSGPNIHLTAFMDMLPARARVLDLGCGPGTATATMRNAGHIVDAWDASPEMADIGKQKHGIEIRIARFDELATTDTYDGIYANFSLLHTPKSAMPGNLARIARALKQGGILHIGLKSGTGEARDALGRFYAYYEDDELTQLLQTAGLVVETRAFGEGEGLDGTSAPWMIFKARKND